MGGVVENRGCVLLWEPKDSGWQESVPAKGNKRAPAVSSALLPDQEKHRYGQLGPRPIDMVSTPARSTEFQQGLLGIA